MSITRNTTYNLIGSLLPLVVSLVTVPIYLRIIGEERYGVLSICWLLLGYFGLFDLGLGRATAQRISALGGAPAVERAQTFWTALSMNLGLGVLGGLLLWPFAAYFFSDIFKVEDTLRVEILTAVPWLILAVPMATLSGVVVGALQGLERFKELNLISVVSTTLFQVLPLFVAQVIEANLVYILPAALLARLFSLLILYLHCRHHLLQGFAPSFDKSQALQLLQFGGWVTVSSFISPIMVTIDRFIIGGVSGAQSVTYYTVPFQLGSRMTIIPNALTSALFPRFAVADASERQRLTKDSLLALLVIMTPIVVVGIFLIEPFLSWWIGPAFAKKSGLVGQILLLGIWANGFARVPYANLQASGRPGLVAKCHLVEVLPYFALLYLGLLYFGLPGAAAAFSLRVFADFFLLSSLSGAAVQIIRLFLAPAVLLGLAFLCSKVLTGQFQYYVFALINILLTVVWAFCVAPQFVKSLIFRSYSFFSYLNNRS